ncbi:MAG: fumarate hydratase C-terminal domain-containing protein [Hadesarchaea archaeon]|nr:fumarate hydratase C-terminal domain-containing protein [Hadesarchaea archaeon]
MSGEKIKSLTTPLTDKDIDGLEVGDLIEISGTIVTARDKAYARVLEYIRANKELPLDLNNKVIYHCGPLTQKNNDDWKVMAAGPTTSARLDDIQVEFVEQTGVKGLIGKGGLSKKVGEKISDLGCIYLAFTGGAGALAAETIESVEDVIWSDLGSAEAIWVLEVKKFGPLTVAIDSEGASLYSL